MGARERNKGARGGPGVNILPYISLDSLRGPVRSDLKQALRVVSTAWQTRQKAPGAG